MCSNFCRATATTEIEGEDLGPNKINKLVKLNWGHSAGGDIPVRLLDLPIINPVDNFTVRIPVNYRQLG